MIREDEICDDGNTLDGDGCSSDCVEEAGFECRGEPSDCSQLSEHPGDANCDGRLGAADLVRFVTLIADDQRSACGGDDLTGDGNVASDDLDAGIVMIFNGSTP